MPELRGGTPSFLTCSKIVTDVGSVFGVYFGTCSLAEIISAFARVIKLKIVCF